MVYAILFAPMSMQVFFYAFDCCNYIRICVMCASISMSTSMSIDRMLLHRTTTLRATNFTSFLYRRHNFMNKHTRSVHINTHIPKILTERISHKPNFKDIDILVLGLLSSSTEIRQANSPSTKTGFCMLFSSFSYTYTLCSQLYLRNQAFS